MTDVARRAVYIETNIFIYAVEGTAETSGPAKDLVRALRKRPGVAVTSEVTLAEVLAPPRRPDAMPLHLKRRAYLDLLVWSAFVELVPVSRDVLYETADLRDGRKLTLPDAIHLATAIRANCTYFVSHDDDFERLPPGMNRIRPETEPIQKLLGEIA